MPSLRESTVIYIACDPPALIWSGVGDLFLQADNVLPTGMVALGAGELVSPPDFQQLIGGTAERLDLIVSGVDDEITRMAVQDAASVEGARVDIGTVSFDDNWQIMGMLWEQTFQAKSLTISRPPAGNTERINRSITLSIVQGASTRGRARISFFTDSDQRRKSPTDAVFSNVGLINMGTSRRFGPK